MIKHKDVGFHIHCINFWEHDQPTSFAPITDLYRSVWGLFRLTPIKQGFAQQINCGGIAKVLITDPAMVGIDEPTPYSCGPELIYWSAMVKI